MKSLVSFIIMSVAGLDTLFSSKPNDCYCRSVQEFRDACKIRLAPKFLDVFRHVEFDLLDRWANVGDVGT